MADLEVAVRYKTLPNKVGLWIMTALFPIWALIIPTCLGLMTRLLMTSPVEPGMAMYLLFGLASAPVLAIFLTAYFEDDRIHISQGGISLPLFLTVLMGFRRTRSWEELDCADIKQNPSGESGKLELRFKSGGKLRLNTQCLKKSDLEQLLLAVELWGANCQRSAELISYQYKLQNQNAGLGQLSYTQMWEEELSRRFSATSFVPLEPDKELRDGQLKIVRQIAFGGLSAIYLAQRDKHELVVLKEAVVPANSDVETRRKAEELFAREAQLLITLNHEGIARVLDHFVEDGRNYLMLEYVNGQDLRQYVKQNGPQSEETVLNWTMQIADRLHYLHSQDPPIIHRDLTPDNLVLKNDGTIVLIDFGAANQFVGTATGTLVGKQSYIAPEQLRGKANLQSDLYALGGTIYYLLTGKDPIPLAATDPNEGGAGVSTDFNNLVLGLTKFDAEDRIKTTQDVLDKLRSISASDKPAQENQVVASIETAK